MRGHIAGALSSIVALLLMLTLAPRILTPPDKTAPMASFDVAPDAPSPDRADPAPRPETRADSAQPQPQPRPDQPRTPAPVQPPATPVPADPPPLLNIPLGQVPDIASLPRGPAAPAPARRAYGPAAPAPDPGDSRRVEGRGPNGEPLYAATWFREPYDSELRGYLSTARPPGWALIACRTVADFRVDNCALLDEYPDNAQIGRAVLAAAWQFRVRPPRLRGQYQVGEWVRIKITYDVDRIDHQ